MSRIRFLLNAHVGFAVLVALVTYSAFTASASESLTLIDGPPIIVDPATKAGAGLMQVRNNGPTDLQVSLTVTDFVNAGTGKPLGLRLLSVRPGEAVFLFSQTLKSGNVLVLKVDAQNI